jgi:hypothetical protein
MFISKRSIRNATVGAVGAGMVTGAMLVGGAATAQAAPPPAPGTGSEMAGPHGAPAIPTDDHGWGGRDHDGDGRGGWGRGGDWDHGGWGRGGDWDHGGWGRGDWDDHPGWGWGHGGWGDRR